MSFREVVSNWSNYRQYMVTKTFSVIIGFFEAPMEVIRRIVFATYKLWYRDVNKIPVRVIGWCFPIEDSGGLLKLIRSAGAVYEMIEILNLDKRNCEVLDIIARSLRLEPVTDYDAAQVVDRIISSSFEDIRTTVFGIMVVYNDIHQASHTRRLNTNPQYKEDFDNWLRDTYVMKNTKEGVRE